MTTNTLRKKTALAPKRSISSVKKKFTMFRCKVRSMHPSHQPLRLGLPLLPFKSVVRLGSTTIEPDVRSLGGNRVECNTIEGIRNSSSKLLMKQCFNRAGVKTAEWFIYTANGFRKQGITPEGLVNINDLPYPIIAKTHQGSRNNGNIKLDTQEQLETWMRGKTLSNYIFEKFYSYNREYRLHVTNDGCFYTCRKLLRDGTPEADKWHRHDTNSVWIVETNPSFDKPVNWDAIVSDCIVAKMALGLDICCFDVKVQSANDHRGNPRVAPEWIVIESGSAPSFGDQTLAKYLIQIPIVLKAKYENRG